MPFLRNLASVVRGALWLVRSGGLRADIDQLLRRAAPPLAGGRRPARLRTPRLFAERRGRHHPRDSAAHRRPRRYFVEFGVESGTQCNCARLACVEGWAGLFLEADAEHFAKLTANYRDCPRVRCVREVVTSANIEALLAAQEVPADLDVLSIDIDSNDYWVWRAVHRWRPRLVVIEYNATHPPPALWVMQENPAHRWDGSNYFGASLASLAALGREKGYTLVATDSTGVNAFFVADELMLPGRFLDPALHYHYSPLNNPLVPDGFPPRSGPSVAR